MLKIDSHHHLWRFSDEYAWISDDMATLRRDFLVEDLRAEMRQVGISGAVAVQARQTLEETAWLLELATPASPVAGVVGWLPIAAEDFPSQLERFAANPRLRGLRHVVQAEPDGFLDAPEFNRGIASITHAGLVYDILIFARQLPEAIRFVDRHPDQAFVLDHIAKPDIRAGAIQSWTKDIRALAQRPNVACKLSGMITETDWRSWTSAELQPYFDVVLEAFGPDRLMAGTDWPVLTVGASYAVWWQTLEGWISALSPTEKAQILGRTAARVYGLDLSQLSLLSATVGA
ncbi:amidohydrolase family protein [Silvibacterium dinghuense]|uniref:Amidohydrolase n=1 Tax=Silvibacterium dinghuense TaxID=1560006 RepID=A0A4Q1SGI0_9BACT|nr:amidohydrolase family protein [Silvibacterium dinghuense]RXS96433.1 amidohydrolase [Silvibacterium dinghuense]GGG90722.1 amidohydrolase [Silvibacterium dinghuense]